MPAAKQKGGITVPKTAKIIPHFNKLPPKEPFIKNTGGRMTKISKQAPVIISALFCNMGYSLPNLALSIKNMA
ncbi:hypothetical protein D9M68_903280 [compost metagenome]